MNKVPRQALPLMRRPATVDNAKFAALFQKVLRAEDAEDEPDETED